MSNYIETFRGVVYPWHCDHQGHMNTMHYVGMFDQAFWHHMSALGFTRDYMDRNRCGFVDVRDTIEYRAEQGVGSLIVIESGLLKIGNTSMTAIHRMGNIETGELAATSEKISVYFDLEARSKTPFPSDLRPNMEANIVELDT
ncbi:MAG: acyl-CoA thioesterase [Deltaproteobacteria bacterium]|jgi:acyl-CoA thioester hydrolase|nr:acyl-CoA thioesterase [Deltaproteobacteria bacterium]MBW2540997.1 acyl-CoA thioesterase [Deltaproteobacteria bacterium]